MKGYGNCQIEVRDMPPADLFKDRGCNVLDPRKGLRVDGSDFLSNSRFQLQFVSACNLTDHPEGLLD